MTGERTMYKITLIPGDGIGPEVALAARRVVDAAGLGIEWHVVEAGEAQMPVSGTPLPQETIDSVRRDGIALKGPITTPVGSGFRSVNVALRKEFGLYANVRPVRTFPGVKSRYEGVDLVVVRENTEDLYAGIEHMIGDYAAESIKLITRAGSERIARYAFDYAVQNGRRRVTAVHKANIMKCTDGLFLEAVRSVAAEYPQIEFTDEIVDAACMHVVQQPENYDVLVLPNLYGDIMSDLCAGLAGGIGLAPSANIGDGCAIFEAVHGSAPRHAGKNDANPTALILSAVMMLRYLGEDGAAAAIESAVLRLLEGGVSVTRDLGGELGTAGFADAVIAEMKK